MNFFYFLPSLKHFQTVFLDFRFKINILNTIKKSIISLMAVHDIPRISATEPEPKGDTDNFILINYFSFYIPTTSQNFFFAKGRYFTKKLGNLNKYSFNTSVTPVILYL